MNRDADFQSADDAASRRHPTVRPRGSVRLIVMAGVLAWGLSACTTRASGSPRVAAIGPSTASQPGPALGPSGSPAGSPTVQRTPDGSSTATDLLSSAIPGSSPGPSADPAEAELGYAQCMRSHGIPDFPDPDPGGGFALAGGPHSDLNPTNPIFQNAQAACQHLMGGGDHGTAAQEAEDGAKLLTYAKCMRSHGIANFPDPTRHPDGGYGFLFTPSLNQSSPTYQAANQACQNLLP